MNQNTITLDSLFSNIEQENEVFKILNVLLNPEDHLELKTEIKKPFLFSALRTYKDFLTKHGLGNSANIINTFENNSYKLLISKDRKSREEIIKAIASSNSNIENQENFEMKGKKGLVNR